MVVGEADTVAAGLAAALELRPDSALVDIGLPDGNGMTLAGTLSASDGAPRIILTSADDWAVGPDDLAASGAVAFVPKGDLPNVLGALLTGS